MPLHNLCAIALPYCLQRQADWSYIVLNRNYKPLGFASLEFVEYSDYPLAVRLPGLTAGVAERLSWNHKPDLERIFLYDDGTTPTRSAAAWRDYSDRLALLASLRLERA